MVLLFILFGVIVFLFSSPLPFSPPSHSASAYLFFSNTEATKGNKPPVLGMSVSIHRCNENIPVRLYAYSAFSFQVGGRSFNQSQLT